jgi:2-polyprenyl-3-methyl-5-hydroxy-6-metoxy-1,4-benzoquinol methylase
MFEYKVNNSSLENITDHLKKCSNLFTPSLGDYVDIEMYSKKLHNKGVRFECYHNSNLIGLLVLYTNPKNKTSFITNVSVEYNYQKNGIAKELLYNCKEYVISQNYCEITLEVFKNNLNAIKFYKRNKFKINDQTENKLIMKLDTTRNYNEESLDTKDHKYSYNFDFDVMHNYMVKSFIPFFKGDNVLELGSYKGDFTEKIIPFFKKITCIEGSEDAVKIANKKFNNDVNIILSTFEDLNMSEKFDNVILTHVLEHIDNPVRLLKKINDNWLTDDGVLFVVCPNANAPSRQIAVKMGLISNNNAITESEKKHGHNITYTLDTLERDITESGLEILHRSGIFFKALANFQWDRLLSTDIISKEYLDGCFKLGQQYPDLCSSIMFVCKKGKK